MKQTSILVVIFLMVVLTVLENISGLPKERLAKQIELLAKQIELVEQNAFKEISLEARAVYVYDVVEDRPLYAKNETVPLPLASLTKLMTSAVALDLAPMNTIVTIESASLKEEGDTGLRPGEKWTLGNLVAFTLTTSSNDGAHALASAVTPLLRKSENNISRSFIETMNEKAQRLGLASMSFSDPTGLDKEGGIASGYGSAKEITLLLLYLLKQYPELLETTAYLSPELSSLNAKHTAVNTNKEVVFIPGLLASKTGFTDLAGGNLTIAFDAGLGHPVIVTVLGSTLEGRFSDVRELRDRSLKAIGALNFVK